MHMQDRLASMPKARLGSEEMKLLSSLTPAEKDRLLAEHFEPTTTWSKSLRMRRQRTDRMSDGGMWWAENHHADNEHRQPRSFTEPEMTVLLMASLPPEVYVALPYTVTGELPEAVRDAALLTFGLVKQ